MKDHILFSCIACLFIISCEAPDKWERYMPGVYIHEFTNDEGGKFYDTIRIQLTDIHAHQYAIVHSVRRNRMLDGEPLPTEYKVSRTVAIYYPDEKLLKEQPMNFVYSFDIQKRILFKGNQRFNKIELP